MCKNCGCSPPGGLPHHHRHDHPRDDHGHVHYDENGKPYTHTHSHDHEHGHDHGHGHEHGHDHGHGHEHEHAHAHNHTETRVVPMETAILAANDATAESNRHYFREHGIAVLNLISSPGSGKTSLLEQTLERLKNDGVKTAVIVGDQYGELDAERMRNRGARVTQIQTLDSCHLNADQVARILPEAVPQDTELLIIENVGNLVCPTAFDLGEDHKVALLSTPEGEEKPVKYPGLFAAADLVLLTKMDLAEILGWDRGLCLKNLSLANPAIRTIEVSVRNGLGLDRWLEYLKNLIASKKEENKK